MRRRDSCLRGAVGDFFQSPQKYQNPQITNILFRANFLLFFLFF